ncbi:MAG: thioredoxin family protein [Bacillota bacterium]|jgi:small redox-active disulfide protein 2|nr:thioredoxin family protein [Bacillota bacterium]
MEIKILGTGCAKCKKLEEAAREAVAELGIEATISKVQDLDKILEYDVMMTPGLVIDEEVKCFGRIPTRDEIKGWLRGKNTA